MDLRIAQGFKYHGDDWWSWWVFLDGPDSTLDRVESVVYTLHPTFANPVRTIADRASRFRLEAEGWGVFRIHARVIFSDGSTARLQHDLELLYPDGTATTA